MSPLNKNISANCQDFFEISEKMEINSLELWSLKSLTEEALNPPQ